MNYVFVQKINQFLRCFEAVRYPGATKVRGQSAAALPAPSQTQAQALAASYTPHGLAQWFLPGFQTVLSWIHLRTSWDASLESFTWLL